MDFLKWRYTLTMEYKEQIYEHHYSELHKHMIWDSAYWRKPAHVIERLLAVISCGLVIMTIPMI